MSCGTMSVCEESFHECHKLKKSKTAREAEKLVQLNEVECLIFSKPDGISDPKFVNARKISNRFKNPKCQGIDPYLTLSFARYLWNFGYQKDSIAQIINALPAKLTTAWCRAIDFDNSTSKAWTPRINAENFDSGLYFCTDLPSISDTERESFSSDGKCGFISIHFEPQSQARLHVASNTLAGKIWGLSQKELLNCFANNDLPLPFTELDALRIASYELQHWMKTRLTSYIRTCVGKGEFAMAMLICQTQDTVFDNNTGIAQVVTQSASFSCFLVECLWQHYAAD